MKKTALLMIFAATLGLAACDNKGAEQDSKETTSATSTDASGTTYTTETTKKVDVESDGRSTTVETKETTDPQGLMNKSTMETEVKTETTH
jgi:ABC-type Fe3+-hydroxamate transport system substrate-binding protein